MREFIFRLIDFFYPPFRKFIPKQTFRYAACGGGNMVLGFLIFTGVFHFIARQQEVSFGFVTFKSYSFSLFCSSTVVFIVGFLLNKYVVFTASNLKGHIQLFRYFLSAMSSLCINYVLLNGLVLFLHLYPVLAQVIATAIVVTISFFMQQYFTFRVKDEIPPYSDGQ
jgi:putative flippase GtrA